MRQKLQKLLDWIAAGAAQTRIMQSVFNRLERENRARQEDRLAPSRRRTILTQLVSVVAITICASIMWLGIQRPNSSEAISKTTGIMNLTQSGQLWDVFLGESPQCGTRPCHVTSDWPKHEYSREAVLPIKEFPLRDYKQGQKIYYRTHLRLTDELLRQTEPLVLYSAYIWAERYDVYINNRVVSSGGRESIIATIPREDIGPDGTVAIGIAADPGRSDIQGISHRVDLAVGPWSKLNQLRYRAFEELTSVRMWFLLPALTFTMLFALFVFGSKEKTEALSFVVLGLTLALKHFTGTDFAMRLAPEWFSLRDTSAVFRFLSVCALLVLIHELFRRRNRTLMATVATLCGVAVAVALMTNLTVGPGKFAEYQRLFVWPMQLLALSFGLWVSAATWLFLQRRNISPHRRRTAAVLFVLFLICGVLAILDMFNEFQGQRLEHTQIYEHSLFVVLAAMAAVEFGMVQSQRDFVRDLLGKVVDRRVADQLMLAPNRLKGERKSLSVAFIDIRSFTTWAETLPPEKVVDLLNHWFSAVARIVHDNHGVVDKYLGDGAMCVWGLNPTPQHPAWHAAKAACEIQAFVQNNLFGKDSIKLRVGIGISYGEAVAGIVGSSERYEFTAIGDAVNLAARIQGLTKDLKVDTLASQSCVEGFGQSFETMPFDNVPIRGKSGLYRVHHVVRFHTDDNIVPIHSGPRSSRDSSDAEPAVHPQSA